MVEPFEARRPKEPAVITEVNGLVKFGDVTKSHRKVLVVTPDGEEHEYQLPRGARVNVREGEAVVAGDPLMDGPIDPHEARLRDAGRSGGGRDVRRGFVSAARAGAYSCPWLRTRP